MASSVICRSWFWFQCSKMEILAFLFGHLPPKQICMFITKCIAHTYILFTFFMNCMTFSCLDCIYVFVDRVAFWMDIDLMSIFHQALSADINFCSNQSWWAVFGHSRQNVGANKIIANFSLKEPILILNNFKRYLDRGRGCRSYFNRPKYDKAFWVLSK